MRTARFLALAVTLSLLAGCLARADTLRPLIYPTLAANPDLVLCGPYSTIQAGTANWGTGISGTLHTREFISVANEYRIRQTGTLSRIRVNLQDPVGLTGFYFRVWRKIDGTYDLVGSTQNLAAAMVAGPNTLDLKRPIAVQEGDYYGYRVESTNAYNFFARSGLKSYYIMDANAGLSDFDWEAQPAMQGDLLPIEMYMQAPILVATGDSIMSGFPSNHSFLETSLTTVPGPDIVSYLGEQWRVPRQNMGRPGETTTQIANRFTADVVNLKPRLALLQGGLNDVEGTGTLERFLANWKKMLDACQANAIKPVVLLMTPATVLTTTQSQKRDSWNVALRALADGYPGAVVVDPSVYVGEFRPGGPSNNLWNTGKAYKSVGDHFNEAGYQRIAQAIVDQYTEP